MITDSFDNLSPAKINPEIRKERFKCDACIITFSYIIMDYILKYYDVKEIGSYKTVNGIEPVYSLNYNGKVFALYKTILGAPASVGTLEDVTEVVDTKKFVMFGGSGCLDKEIAHGKIMIPNYAYRDEGTSYHYAAPQDYIEMKNYNIVAEFMDSVKLPYIIGKTWTTDAFFRETENNILKRKQEGCISVEMECSAMQAVCNLRGLELYYFLTSGDLLDAPEWDQRHLPDEYDGTQHDTRHFEIALKLAEYISNK